MSDEQDVTTTPPADPGQDQAAPDAQSKGKGGRPTMYSLELATRICDLVAERVPVVEICDMDGMPDKSTLYRWKRENTEFCDNYARARELRADARQDRIDEIVKQMIGKEIDPAVARVAIDAEKWQMGKEKPKGYSDKLQLVGDADSDPIKHEITRIVRVIVRPGDKPEGP